MRQKLFFGSLTRISDLRERDFEIRRLPREEWGRGDYVVGVVRPGTGPVMGLELWSGRVVEVVDGDGIVGAFGTRCATLEAVGDWTVIGDDGEMEVLTGGALMGKMTSWSTISPHPIPVTYQGHVVQGGGKTAMADYAPVVPKVAFDTPVVLIVGTSMSAGKTTTAKAIIRRLKALDLKVVGSKLTGAGRYRDVLAMRDAGADHIFDFVDVGLPSTAVPADEYRAALDTLLSMIAGVGADVVVVEAGASPLEPYNGGVAVEVLGPHVKCAVLCASDPYAVVGIVKAFGSSADLVSGRATSTRAGEELVEKISGLTALNILDPDSRPALTRILRDTLEL